MAIEMAAQRATQRLFTPLRRGIPATTPRRISTSTARMAGRPVLARPLSWMACSAEARLRTWQSTSIGAGNGAGALRRFSSKEESEVPNSRIYSFDEIRKLVETKDAEEKAIFVDVREPGELLQTGKIPGAINIPITTAIQSFYISDRDFEDMYGFARPAKDAKLVFYCRAGVRARTAAGLAQHAGWTDVGEYPGSWLDWEAKKGPVEKI